MGLLVSPGSDMRQYRDAIASIESAGSGDYAAIGPTHDRLGRALGRYQIMEANIGPWSRAALGREVSPDEFLANPALQDQIFDHQFGGYIEKFGPVGAAEAWFAGPGGVGKTERKDVLGTTVGDYGRKFSAALGMPSTVSTKSPSGGLLSEQEAPPMEQETAGGLLGKLFPNMSADRADELRLAIANAGPNPNIGKIQAIQARMGERAQGRKDAKAQAQAAQQANRTAQWLAGQPGGRPFAEAVASGALPAGEALRMWQAQGKGQEPTALMQNVEYIMRQNPDIPFNDALQVAKSGTTVNVNSGSEIGTIPPSYELFTDAEGNRRMRPIKDSPAYNEQRQAAAAEAERQKAAQAQQGVVDTVVGRDVDRLIDMIDKDGFFDLAETGIVGGLLGAAGVNQEAVDFGNTLKSIQSAIAFETLKQMRAASKTGGALGAVSEKELDLLISAYGALQQNTSGPVLRENLQTIKRLMTKIENDPIASSFYYGGSTSPTSQAPSGGFSVTGRID